MHLEMFVKVGEVQKLLADVELISLTGLTTATPRLLCFGILWESTSGEFCLPLT